MADPVTNSYKSQNYSAATTATLSAANWPAHVANQLIVIVASQDGGNGVVSAPEGWTRHGTRTGTPTGAAYQHVFSKIAVSGSETSPAMTSTVSEEWLLQAFVVADVDTTTPVNIVSAQTDWNASATPSSATVTTTTDNCLLIATLVADSSPQLRCDIGQATLIGQTNAGGFISSAIMFRQLGAAGLTSAIQQYVTTATEGGTSWVLAINNAAGGRLAPDVRIDSDLVNHYGNFGAAVSAVTWLAPEGGTKFAGGFTAGLLDGLPVTAIAPTASTIVLTAVGHATTLSSSESTTGSWVGGWHTVSSSDLIDELFSYEVTTNRVAGQSRIGAKGVIFGFTDGTNYEFFRSLDFLKGWATISPVRSWVSCGNTAPVYSRGTLNWSAITGLCYLWHRDGSSVTGDTMYLQNAMSFRSMTLTGGNAADPVAPRDIPLTLEGHAMTDLAGLRSSAQVQIRTALNIGNGGTNQTIFDASGGSLEYPQAYSASRVTNWQNSWNVPAGQVGITIYAGASDSIDFSTSVLATETAQPLTINASSSASALHGFTATPIIGWDVAWDSDIPISGAAFKRGGTVEAKGADITDAIIADTTSSNAAVSFDATGAVVTRTTIDLTGSTTSYHVELGASNTAITLADVTFSGTPAVDKVHVLATTGTVTITISGSTSLVAGEVTSAGATVVIAAPTPTLDATVLAGSRVVLYNNTTAAELDNAAPAGTSWSKQITSGASSGDSLTLHVFKLGYEEFATTFLYTGADSTPLVSQAIDASEGSLVTELGYDGSAVTEFALDITGTVEIDADDVDGSSLKARFALWYKYILTTENGARYLRGFLSLISPAEFRMNVSVADVKIANISVTQGLQFTDVDRRLYRSDGTPIWATASAPGSIQNDYSGVPDYSLISVGGANIITGDIADIPAAPSAATVAGAVRTELTTELGRLDVAVSSRLAGSGYTTAPSASAVADAVWAKTLP